jgi:hypothetical protein
MSLLHLRNMMGQSSIFSLNKEVSLPIPSGSDVNLEH